MVFCLPRRDAYVVVRAGVQGWKQGSLIGKTAPQLHSQFTKRVIGRRVCQQGLSNPLMSIKPAELFSSSDRSPRDSLTAWFGQQHIPAPPHAYYPLCPRRLGTNRQLLQNGS